ncbi:Scr1 family TA system antitoxin-like transcriptional regulator [Streptomyces sp. NPDC002920]
MTSPIRPVRRSTAMDGPLKLMEFEDAPPLSFVEAPDMGKLLDDPATVARHALMFNLLQASALSPQDYEHGAR